MSEQTSAIPLPDSQGLSGAICRAALEGFCGLEVDRLSAASKRSFVQRGFLVQSPKDYAEEHKRLLLSAWVGRHMRSYKRAITGLQAAALRSLLRKSDLHRLPLDDSFEAARCSLICSAVAELEQIDASVRSIDRMWPLWPHGSGLTHQAAFGLRKPLHLELCEGESLLRFGIDSATKLRSKDTYREMLRTARVKGRSLNEIEISLIKDAFESHDYEERRRIATRLGFDLGPLVRMLTEPQAAIDELESSINRRRQRLPSIKHLLELCDSVLNFVRWKDGLLAANRGGFGELTEIHADVMRVASSGLGAIWWDDPPRFDNPGALTRRDPEAWSLRWLCGPNGRRFVSEFRRAVDYASRQRGSRRKLGFVRKRDQWWFVGRKGKLRLLESIGPEKIIVLVAPLLSAGLTVEFREESGLLSAYGT